MGMDTGLEYGVVLEGGGARGAYQAGALMALMCMDVHITAVVGTSVGALNGAMLAQQEFHKAIAIWNQLKYSQVMEAEDQIMDKIANLDFKGVDMKKVFHGIKQIVSDRGIKITPLKKLIRLMVDEEKVRKSTIKYGLVTYSLSDRKPLELFIEDIEEGRLQDFILASAYFPVFKQEKIHGKSYIDGGVYNNSPTNMLVGKGYKNIIIIKVHGPGIQRKISTKGLNIIEISPKEIVGGILEFNRDKAKLNMKLGYYDTYKVIKGLRGDTYYIHMNKTEKYIVKRLAAMDIRYKKKVCTFIGAHEETPNRGFFEVALPKIGRKLKLHGDWDYSDLLIQILEYLGKTLDIPRFHVYNLDAFIKIVNKKAIKEPDKIKEDSFTKLLASFIQRFSS